MKGVAAFLVVALIWAAGFFAFVARVQQSTPLPEPLPAEGIVALTGPNTSERLGAAVGLLSEHLGQRVLVSGVDRDVSREELRRTSKTVRRLYECCVDLGFTAADTVGNARETAEWAKAMRYESLIIVTSDYHMPRAMLELRSTLPGAKLQPYPVATSVINAHYWWKTSRGARLMVGEYSKYLAILGREMVRGLGPKDAPASAPKG